MLHTVQGVCITMSPLRTVLSTISYTILLNNYSASYSISARDLYQGSKHGATTLLLSPLTYLGHYDANIIIYGTIKVTSDTRLVTADTKLYLGTRSLISMVII